MQGLDRSRTLGEEQLLRGLAEVPLNLVVG